MAITRSPWCGRVSLTDTNAHSLVSLLQALDPSVQPTILAYRAKRCQYLVIGNDIDNGASKLFVGNSNVTSTFYGWKLVASQFVPLYSMDSNLIMLDDIYLLTDAATCNVSLAILTR